MIERLLGVVLAASLCPAALAQSLDARVQELERRVEQLEKQVGARSLASPTDSARPASGQPEGWRQRENWRSLKRGMTQGEVRAILGEASNVRSNVAFTEWEYPGRGRAQFDSQEERLQGWSEPR